MVYIALFTSIMIVCAFITIPFAIPFTLQTFALFTIIGILGTKKAFISVLLYLLLGAVGLPVFSGFCGGLQILTGLTGGYIIGYLPCAAVISFLCEKHGNNKAVFPLSMLLGTVICYLCGASWYIAQTECSVATALLTCIVPFILGDIIKIAAASIISITLRPRLAKILNRY